MRPFVVHQLLQTAIEALEKMLPLFRDKLQVDWNETVIQTPTPNFKVFANFKIWQKNVTIFRATESRLSAGQGERPNVAD